MIAIVTDDEETVRVDRENALKRFPEIDTVYSFETAKQTLEWAENNAFDVAFLDVNIGDMDGIHLASELRSLNHKCYIIVCTSHPEFIFDAYRVHANGYLVKPITDEDLRRELNYILEFRSPDANNEDRVKFSCFGAFEVSYKGKPVVFKRTKSLEMLAVIVDMAGADVSVDKIRACLWEEQEDTDKKKEYVKKLAMDIRNSFAEVGVHDILINHFGSYTIDRSKIWCDYFEYLVDKNTYHPSAYMLQYDWAELK